MTDRALIEALMGPQSPVFGVGSPAETAQQPSGMAGLFNGAYNWLGDLSKRAFGASEEMRGGGAYNPAPAVEAAMLPMGTGAVAGVPVRGAEAVLGAGPIRAYHGSPHDFDRFDLSKIGTGEGAQAYGHGLYFAENEGVARDYRNRLATKAAMPNTNVDSPQSFAALSVQAGGEDQARRNLMNNMRHFGPEDSIHIKSKAALQAIEDGSYKAHMPDPGHMYEVNINADPAHFLDWDKPLSGQSEQIQRQLADVYPGLKGDTVQQAFPHGIRPQISEALNKSGIPGIKYLDQGSRGNVNVNDIRGSLSMWETALRKAPNDPYAVQQVADLQKQLAAAEKGGTSNYVVFNDALIDILKKYGLAGLPAAGATGAAMSPVFQPQQSPVFTDQSPVFRGST